MGTTCTRLTRASVGLIPGTTTNGGLAKENDSRVRAEWGRNSGWHQDKAPFFTSSLPVDDPLPGEQKGVYSDYTPYPLGHRLRV